MKTTDTRGAPYVETGNPRVLSFRYRTDARWLRAQAEESRRRAEALDAAADAAAELTSRLEGDPSLVDEIATKTDRWLASIRQHTAPGESAYRVAMLVRLCVAADETGISGLVEHYSHWHASWVARGIGEPCDCASCRRESGRDRVQL